MEEGEGAEANAPDAQVVAALPRSSARGTAGYGKIQIHYFVFLYCTVVCSLRFT